MTEIYARITNWALLVLRDGDRETVHVIGYIARHNRLRAASRRPQRDDA